MRRERKGERSEREGHGEGLKEGRGRRRQGGRKESKGGKESKRGKRRVEEGEEGRKVRKRGPR